MLMHFTVVRSQQDTSQLPCPAMPNGESATSTSLTPTATNSVSLGLCCPRSNSHLWCGRSIRGLVEPPAVFSTFRSRFKPLAGSRRRATYFHELAQPNLHVQPIRICHSSLGFTDKATVEEMFTASDSAARSSRAANHMRRGIMYNDSLFNAFARSFEARSETDMSMAEYLESCRGDPMRYANAAERLLAAIGEPQMIDTARDPRLGRIFLNRTMRVYPAFTGFHGMEETIERIVGFFRHAAQGLEERKQILYLLGPVGGGKSSLAERLKSLMEVNPIYVLKAGDEFSPVFESPLRLFDPESLGPMIEEKYVIPSRRLNGLMSPWCYKRLESFGGDISRFRVAKIQ